MEVGEPREEPVDPRGFSLEVDGFSDADFEACVKVLSRFQNFPEQLKQKKYKHLRVLGNRVFFSQGSKPLFDGMTKEEYEKMKRESRDRQRREQAMRAADKKLVNSKQLRTERREALKRLLDPQPSSPQMLLENGGPHIAPVADAEHPAPDAEPSASQRESDADPNASEPQADGVDRRGAELDDLHLGRSCYICKARFYRLHFFYDNQCPACAALSYDKRVQSADLTGRIVVLTGARIKIGFHCAVKLLRAGATLVATTRFPHDAGLRFAKESDYDQWKSRLMVYGLDLRDLRSVEEFSMWLRGRFTHIDMLINNAAQSVRKPPAFYAHLMPTELAPVASLPQPVRGVIVTDQPEAVRLQPAMLPAATPGSDAPGLPLPLNSVVAVSVTGDQVTQNRSAAMSQLALLEGDEKHDTEVFPLGKYDVFDQQLDLRRHNSWLLKLDEVSTAEAVETVAINSLAPFILNSKLKPMLMASPFKDRYVINVSAMEGKFYKHKTPNHPHTNMAKAALNMVTRTSSADYAKDGIYMNSVDTGWVTDENPLHMAEAWSAQTNFQAPLDEMEGAARVLDPIFDAIKTGRPLFGKFFKDYHETEW